MRREAEERWLRAMAAQMRADGVEVSEEAIQRSLPPKPKWWQRFIRRKGK